MNADYDSLFGNPFNSAGSQQSTYSSAWQAQEAQNAQHARRNDDEQVCREACERMTRAGIKLKWEELGGLVRLNVLAPNGEIVAGPSGIDRRSALLALAKLTLKS